MIRNQRGSFLQEALIASILLQIIILGLLQTLPTLVRATHLQHQTSLMQTKLYQVADELLMSSREPFVSLDFQSPFSHTISHVNQTLCITYKGDFTYEQVYCLPN